MPKDINKIFQEFLIGVKDITTTNFEILLAANPDIKGELEKKIRTLQRAIGVFKEKKEEETKLPVETSNSKINCPSCNKLIDPSAATCNYCYEKIITTKNVQEPKTLPRTTIPEPLEILSTKMDDITTLPDNENDNPFIQVQINETEVINTKPTFAEAKISSKQGKFILGFMTALLLVAVVFIFLYFNKTKKTSTAVRSIEDIHQQSKHLKYENPSNRRIK